MTEKELVQRVFLDGVSIDKIGDCGNGYYYELTRDCTDWDLCDLQVGELFFLVATPDGIKIVSETEKALLPEFNVLYQGSKQACRNFVKVD